MKRLQIMIEEEVDAELERAALEAGMSKAAVVGFKVRERLKPLPSLSADLIGRIAGSLTQTSLRALLVAMQAGRATGALTHPQRSGLFALPSLWAPFPRHLRRH